MRYHWKGGDGGGEEKARASFLAFPANFESHSDDGAASSHCAIWGCNCFLNDLIRTIAKLSRIMSNLRTFGVESFHFNRCRAGCFFFISSTDRNVAMAFELSDVE